jgi:FkbM family methyltransferase
LLSKREISQGRLDDKQTLQSLGWILQSYLQIIWFALRHLRADRKDLACLVSILELPLLYVLGFKGKLETVLGKFLVNDRAILRASIYGTFKTQFCYLRTINSVAPHEFFHTVVDVGANIGDFTLGMFKQLSAKIVAIEPGVHNFEVLTLNIALNKVANAILLNLAAHNRRETVHFVGTNSNLHIDSSSNGQPSQGIPIDSVMLDLGIGKIDLLKIDAQGHEKPVLLGMHNLLGQGAVRFVLVEVHLKRGSTVEEISSLMESYGYKLARSDQYLFEQPHLCFVSNGGLPPESSF